MSVNDLASLLKANNLRIVFAESCTAGLVSGKLAEVPGISAYHCGSFATYREQSKMDWIGVSRESLEQFTAVSETVTIEMASGALERTVEADLAVAVTGHLGPNAPESLDGVVFVAIHFRGEQANATASFTLSADDRARRIEEAATRVVDWTVEQLRDR